MNICRECHSGYDHKICNVCRFKYCNICLDLNHHDDMIEHLEKTDFIICGRCLYSYKRIYKFINKNMFDICDLVDERDKFI